MAEETSSSSPFAQATPRIGLENPSAGLAPGDFYTLVSYDHLVFGTHDPILKDVQFIVNSAEINLSFGLIDRLFATMLIPFSQKTAITHPNDQRDLLTTRGLGDMLFALNYLSDQTQLGQGLSYLIISLGVQAPTGRFGLTSPMGRVARFQQPGRGNWGVVLQGFYTYQTDHYSLSALGFYSAFIEGHNYRFGDELNYALAADVVIARWAKEREATLSASLEIDGEWVQRDRSEDLLVGNSGGYSFALVPGLVFNYEAFNLELFYIHPLLSKHNVEHGLPLQPELLPGHSWAVELSMIF